nr:unnamed protein product [Callosobruchus chinensis]
MVFPNYVKLFHMTQYTIIVTRQTDAYSPEEHLSLDESMLLFRGRLSFRMYLCGRNGYVFNMEIYEGKQETIAKEPNLDSLVLRLMHP